MSNFTQAQLEERYETLPEVLKDALYSVEIANDMVAVGKQFGLNIEQTGELAEEAGYLVMGLIPPRAFIDALALRLGIDKTKAGKIAGEVNQKIFTPLREAVKNAHSVDVNDIETSHTTTTPPRPTGVMPPPKTSPTDNIAGRAPFPGKHKIETPPVKIPSVPSTPPIQSRPVPTPPPSPKPQPAIPPAPPAPTPRPAPPPVQPHPAPAPAPTHRSQPADPPVQPRSAPTPTPPSVRPTTPSRYVRGGAAPLSPTEMATKNTPPPKHQVILEKNTPTSSDPYLEPVDDTENVASSPKAMQQTPAPPPRITPRPRREEGTPIISQLSRLKDLPPQQPDTPRPPPIDLRKSAPATPPAPTLPPQSSSPINSPPRPAPTSLPPSEPHTKDDPYLEPIE